MAPDPAGILASAAVPGFRIQLARLWPAGRFVALREALAWIEAG